MAIRRAQLGEQRRFREGVRYLQKAISLEPANVPAGELLIRLEGKLAGR